MDIIYYEYFLCLFNDFRFEPFFLLAVIFFQDNNFSGLVCAIFSFGNFLLHGYNISSRRDSGAFGI